jgi:D-inositol-3-phosphate glycosyltransferase
MRRLLWIGDAAVATGFAKNTHACLEVLRRTWDVHVLALNYRGDPHAYPYPLWPAVGNNPHDGFGLSRIADLVRSLRPQMIVIQNDPWNIPSYLDELVAEKLTQVPVVAVVAVDGKNCAAYDMNPLHLAIFWTQFAADEAKRGGYGGPTSVIPLGVDLDVFKPMDQVHARQSLQFKAGKEGPVDGLRDAFIVGNVNRNQPRKRMDLTIRYFAEWVKSYKIDNAYLFLHVAPTGEMGVSVKQLMNYYGVHKRIILAEPPMGQGYSEATVAATYNTFDVQITTTQGEGFGLTTLEGMACGIPQIVPDWSALGEWAKSAVYAVPCTSTAVGPPYVNVIGGIADEKLFIDGLQYLYKDRAARERMSHAGLALAREPRFRWENIGLQMATELDKVVNLAIEDVPPGERAI